MGEKFLRMLIRLLRSDCTAISWSALEVVGNIARLGKDDEIKAVIWLLLICFFEMLSFDLPILMFLGHVYASNLLSLDA